MNTDQFCYSDGGRNTWAPPSHIFWRTGGLLCLLFAGFIAYSWNQPIPVVDENLHWPIIWSFRDMLYGKTVWTLNYDDTVGPFFFVTYATWGSAYVDLVWLRFLSFLCFAGSFVLLIWWLRVERRDLIFYTLAYGSGVWALRSAFMIYSEQLTQFIAVISIILLTSPVRRPQCDLPVRLGGAVALSLIPLTRAYSSFMFPLILMHFSLQRENVARNLALLCCAALPGLYLFYHWNGLTPPGFRINRPPGVGEITASANALMYIPVTLAHIGFYLSPWLMCAFRKVMSIPIRLLLAYVFVSACLTVPLGGTAGSGWSGHGTIGPLQRSCDVVAELAPEGSPVLAILVWCPEAVTFIGFFSLVLSVDLIIRLGLYRDWRARLALGAFAIYPISLAFSGALLFERYFLPMNIFVLTLGWLLTNDVKRYLSPFLLFAAIALAHAYSSPWNN